MVHRRDNHPGRRRGGATRIISGHGDLERAGNGNWEADLLIDVVIIGRRPDDDRIDHAVRIGESHREADFRRLAQEYGRISD